VLTSIDAFLAYFDAVNRRALRDIGALPREADGWRPSLGEGEKAWSINQIVGHMASSRLYFASAYRGEGWLFPEPPDTDRADRWLPAIEESAVAFRDRLADTPDEWLQRKIALIDSDGAISGWRVLLMMVEHDIHHRSQLDTYAGINGWDVPHIYGRSAEQVGAMQGAEQAKHRA
jgi:uncharacterized damage-inducible protein DinB